MNVGLTTKACKEHKNSVKVLMGKGNDRTINERLRDVRTINRVETRGRTIVTGPKGHRVKEHKEAAEIQFYDFAIFTTLAFGDYRSFCRKRDLIWSF